MCKQVSSCTSHWFSKTTFGWECQEYLDGWALHPLPSCNNQTIPLLEYKLWDQLLGFE
jgi:hypothetical protein